MWYLPCSFVLSLLFPNTFDIVLQICSFAYSISALLLWLDKESQILSSNFCSRIFWGHLFNQKRGTKLTYNINNILFEGLSLCAKSMLGHFAFCRAFVCWWWWRCKCTEVCISWHESGKKIRGGAQPFKCQVGIISRALSTSLAVRATFAHRCS